jgi:hypothetical protein
MWICTNILGEYKRMMWIHGVCEYTETCNYVANKIHIRFKLRSEEKKVRIWRTLLSHCISLLKIINQCDFYKTLLNFMLTSSLLYCTNNWYFQGLFFIPLHIVSGYHCDKCYISPHSLLYHSVSLKNKKQFILDGVQYIVQKVYLYTRTFKAKTEKETVGSHLATYSFLFCTMYGCACTIPLKGQ